MNKTVKMILQVIGYVIALVLGGAGTAAMLSDNGYHKENTVHVCRHPHHEQRDDGCLSGVYDSGRGQRSSDIRSTGFSLGRLDIRTGLLRG